MKSSVGHPHANGQVEVTNRIFLRSLETQLFEAKGKWAEELLGVIWANKTTPKSITGETPFKLAYGTEADIPVEIGLASFRVKHFDEQANLEGLCLNLDLLDEDRERPLYRMAKY